MCCRGQVIAQTKLGRAGQHARGDVEFLLARRSRGKQLLPPGLELPVQLRDERKGVVRQDLLEFRRHAPGNGNALGERAGQFHACILGSPHVAAQHEKSYGYLYCSR